MGLSSIQWTDYSYNPWRGCRKVAPECENCYITSTAPFRVTGQKHGSERVRASESTLAQPLAWNRHLAEHNAEHGDNQRARVFCLSLGDWLDDENVPIEWLADLLAMIHATPNLDWLLLTKRPRNFEPRLKAVMRRFEDDSAFTLAILPPEYHIAVNWSCGETPNNVWIGVSAGADQSAALAIPARVHFLSCEPMLHELDTTHAARFDWIIFGGESGRKARPANAGWIRQGVKFCRDHNIPPFVKQLGAHVWDNEFIPEHVLALSDSHGGDMAEWPEDLRVREFPKA